MLNRRALLTGLAGIAAVPVLAQVPALAITEAPLTHAEAWKHAHDTLREFIRAGHVHDFAVLCDETNNSPERRERNELWVDSLIQFRGSAEQRYVPTKLNAKLPASAQRAIIDKRIRLGIFGVPGV